ncbi:glycosyltransferase, partial [Patescibacteria group bacterium]|nr:glycosyltransferase [Patescibacteria group bacterium]
MDEKILMVFNLIESKRTEEMKLNISNPPNPHLSSGAIRIFDGMGKEELRCLIASVDCVVAPSLSEGFGSVHTETCAMKIPLITTNVASIPEVVSGN